MQEDVTNHYVLSRRKAIALFGISAASIAAATTPNPSAAQASTGELDDVAASARPPYIFGYGSLVQRESRVGTWPSAEFASPVIVNGIARGASQIDALIQKVLGKETFAKVTRK